MSAAVRQEMILALQKWLDPDTFKYGSLHNGVSCFMIQAIYDDLRSQLAKDHLWKTEGTHWNLKYTKM